MFGDTDCVHHMVFLIESKESGSWQHTTEKSVLYWPGTVRVARVLLRLCKGLRYEPARRPPAKRTWVCPALELTDFT